MDFQHELVAELEQRIDELTQQKDAQQRQIQMFKQKEMALEKRVKLKFLNALQVCTCLHP